MKDKSPAKAWSQGHINWYDPHSGKGSIIGDDGVWYRIHEFSEIQESKKAALKEKARVEFVLASDSVRPIIKSVRQAVAVRAVPTEKVRRKTRDV